MWFETRNLKIKNPITTGFQSTQMKLKDVIGAYGNNFENNHTTMAKLNQIKIYFLNTTIHQ